MAEKRSFKQAMGQEKINRKKIIQIMVAAVAGVFLLVLVFMALGGGEEEVAAPEPVSTPMVPTSLRYYDPLSEETYETGVNYVILNQSDGSRIRVSDDGRVVEIDERGNVLREISDGSEYISTVRGLMATDSQLAMAMDGLAVEEDVAPEMSPYDEFYQSFLEYAESQGVDLDTLLSGLYAEGYGPDRLFELQDAGLPWRGVVNEVVAGIRETESQGGEDGQTSQTPQTGPATIDFGDTGSQNGTSSTTTELPSWLQPVDVSESMNALVDSLVAASSGTSSGSQTAYDQQNRQAERQAWMEQQQETGFSYDGRLTKWDLAQGSVIPLTLVTGLNTDMPGEIVGLVRQNIYDTLTGTNIVIPKGSRVIATYDSSVAFMQERVAIAWNRLITPDGYMYTLPGFIGVDGEGYAGNEDKHSNHIWSLIGGAMLASLIDLGTNSASVASNSYSSAYPSTASLWQLLTSGVDASGDVADMYVERLINRQPTIKIRPGAQITMLVTDTINLQR